jgi:hypothetical protein
VAVVLHAELLHLGAQGTRLNFAPLEAQPAQQHRVRRDVRRHAATLALAQQLPLLGAVLARAEHRRHSVAVALTHRHPPVKERPRLVRPALYYEVAQPIVACPLLVQAGVGRVHAGVGRLRLGRRLLFEPRGQGGALRQLRALLGLLAGHTHCL